ncbi:MAG: tryptophanase [Thermoanaerobaculaceae bacterium]|nr:tryptophanase [Thermoanaerobaculaceae bacterium]
MKTVIEPFRIKVVEPIRMTTEEERQVFIREAGYNPFRIRAEHVLIDLLTDSGTGAMSTRQWAGIMEGDESYAGARSYFRFEEAVRAVFGHRHVIPTHQGRASERLLCRAVVKPGDVIPGNTHFDTTRANIEDSHAEAVDLPIAEARDPGNLHPFKGNIDLDALEACLRTHGRERVPFVLITVTNNSGGGQPVSMANLRATRALCDRYGVPLVLDAARFAENAYFIKLREDGYADRTPREIAREMFSLSDGALMSMKKDAFGNIGGVVSLNSDEWAERVRTLLILTEGFVTYGGLAGRDLEALAIGLEEVLEEEYLRYRIASTAYVGRHLEACGVPLLKPFGGHAVYLDGRAFCEHISNENLPGWSLSVALYERIGLRACEIGNVMFGRQDPATGTWRWPPLDLVRLAIPRRVYTQSHMDYVIEGIDELYRQRRTVRGLRFVHRPPVLPHFTAVFEPVA